NGGKTKYPYFVYLPEEPIFSIGGLWSTWTDRQSGEVVQTYTVLTTRANSLMEKIHNSKKRMPVIIPREYEQDWIGSRLTKDDVLRSEERRVGKECRCMWATYHKTKNDG